MALVMVAAWKAQATNSHLLRAHYGPKNFFDSGIWANRDSWHLNNERVSKRAAPALAAFIESFFVEHFVLCGTTKGRYVGGVA
jgi:hypothetical protein